MITAIDTGVLLDVFDKDAGFVQRSLAALHSMRDVTRAPISVVHRHAIVTNAHGYSTRMAITGLTRAARRAGM